MKKCTLCWETKDAVLNIRGPEGLRLGADKILKKHFDFCFQDEHDSEFVCRDCWEAASNFHEFYKKIEIVHHHQITPPKIEPIEVETCEPNVDVPIVWIEPKLEIYEPEFTDALTSRIDGGDSSDQHESNDDVQDDESADDDKSDEEGPIRVKTSKKREHTTRRKKSALAKFSPSLDFVCKEDNCGKKFRSNHYLKKHLKLGHEKVICDMCGSTMLKGALMRHMYKMHRTITVAYKEANGEKVLMTQTLDQQVEIEPGEVGEASAKREFPCTVPNCNKKFANSNKLLYHLRWSHERRECEVCKKSIRAASYMQHLRTVHNREEQNVCELCGTVCKTKHSYKVHMLSKHTKSDPVQCEVCGTWFKNKIRKQHHYWTAHVNPERHKPVTCPVCGVITKNSRNLKSHMKVHDDTYKDKFICSICGFRCANNTQLRQHSDTHKSFRDRIKCDQCDKDFASKPGLRRHYVIHTQTGPFTCPYCPRTYTYECGVRLHIKRNHKIEEANRKAAIEQERLENLEKLKRESTSA